MIKVNVIAMAGVGKRFLDRGIKVPKPLIPVNGKPMFLYAALSLPVSNKFFFICNKKLLSKSYIRKIIKENFKKKKIISVNKTTSGQAITCDLATKYIKKNDVITFGSCDYKYNFNYKKYKRLLKISDVIIFVYKPKKYNLENPRDYGWIKIKNKNAIRKITCKHTASRNPKKDYVIVGSFTFKNKKIFKNSLQKMIKEKDKVNNEYYMDIVAKYAQKLGYKVNYCLVNNYKSFGTPQNIKL